MNARRIMVLVALVFMAFAAFCIANASFVAQDGQRYFTIADDALISLRYAWNLAHGHGLVWNAGERVEGFTNPLWTLYAAVWAVFTPRRLVPLVMQISGVLCLLAQACVFARVMRALSAEHGRETPWKETLAFALPLTYGPLVYWSMDGLEVCLVGFLVSLAVLYYLQHRLMPVAVALGLAFWTRPDTALPAAVIMGMAGLDVLHDRDRLRPWLKTCGVLAGMVATVFILREIYYGHTWPNTYVLKMRGFPLLARIKLNGLGYITPFLRETALPLGLALLILVVGWTRRRALFAAVVLTMIAYAVYVGGDALPHWRFIAPYVPFLGLVILDVDDDAGWLPAPRFLFRAAMVAALFSAWMMAAVEPLSSQARGPQPIEQTNIERALEINRLLKPAATIGVLHAGSIPYYTDFHACDFLGKCDKAIARLPPNLRGPSWGGMQSVPGHNKHNVYASIAYGQPTYIQGCRWDEDSAADNVHHNYEYVPSSIDTYFSGTWILLLKYSPLVRWDRVLTQYQQHRLAAPSSVTNTAMMAKLRIQ